MRRIYLDYNASTPIDPAVAAAMRPYLEAGYGNPSSGHWAATPAKAALEGAREQVAALLGCAPDEVVFTSGGSEANNLALKGVFFALRERGDHIVTTQVEHPAILAPCHFLEHHLGARVTYLPVDGSGRVDPTTCAPRSRLRPSSSALCTPTTRSARSSRSKLAPGSLASAASCSTRTRHSRSTRSRPGRRAWRRSALGRRP